MAERLRRIAIAVAVPILLAVILETLSRVGLLGTLIPSPLEIFAGLKTFATTGVLIPDLLATTKRVARGLLLGIGLGLSLGTATSLSPKLRALVEPVLQLLRPIPAFALVPVAIVLFGVGELAKIFIVAWASFFPSWLSTHSAVSRVPRDVIWTARLLGARRLRTILSVQLRYAAPEILAGLRIALGLGFAATVVAEMSGADFGLGYRVIASHLAFRFDLMLAAILMIGLLGSLLDTIVFRLLRRLLT